MKEELKRQVAAEAAKIIYANEGNYASVNPDDNGALSVGMYMTQQGTKPGRSRQRKPPQPQRA